MTTMSGRLASVRIQAVQVAGMGTWTLSGFTREVNSLITFLPSCTKMEISVILFPFPPKPVVSISTIAYTITMR